MNGNRWDRFDVVYRLKSPLHIGYMPYKEFVISPTRYYVLGRNFWGAVTKMVTEYLYKNPDSERYKRVGGQIINNFRFSYFYVYDEENVYIPEYTDDGLKFGDKDKISLYEFEYKFISSRISTAIDFLSGTAKNESLHELEFINNKFKDENGNLKSTRIIGCIWIKKDAKIEDKYIKISDSDINPGIFIDNFNIIEKLILGGESKYGFGHVLLESINKRSFPLKSEESGENVKIKIEKSLPAHLKYNESIEFEGDVELLSGRGYFDPKKESNTSAKPGDVVSPPEYYFSPGTLIGNFDGEINWDGTIEKRTQVDDSVH